ncbi:hypothetical protein SLS60_006307 [Paraconiothyrium brasiliense]|uniref:Uncharacterized protein n=1 Tax=Paraconiothyrium brasiliense TaxID=300254 RepID=A0ABR3RAD6_9PLEO
MHTVQDVTNRQEADVHGGMSTTPDMSSSTTTTQANAVCTPQDIMFDLFPESLPPLDREALGPSDAEETTMLSTKPTNTLQLGFDTFPYSQNGFGAQQRIQQMSALNRTAPRAPLRRHESNDECARFDHILKAMDAVGFSTFDDMATAYYTTHFPPSSVAYDMQQRSRVRHLRSLAANLNRSAQSWSVREKRGWQEEIVHSTEEYHLEQVQHFLNAQNDASPHFRAGQNGAVTKAILQDRLPDLWSLLSRIVAASNLEPSYSPMVVFSVFQVLLGCSPTNLPMGANVS